MNGRHRQQGLTGLGWLIILFVVGFFTLAGIKLTPIYVQNFSVKSSLESLKKEAHLTQKSKQEILTLLMKRLDINDVTHVTRKDIVIEERNGVLTVGAKYEVRERLVGNLDIVANFDNRIEVVAH